LTASCLLTTSLDGLEGPPVSGDAGGPDGGAPDGSEAGWEDGSDGGADVSADTGPDAEGGSDTTEDDGNADEGAIDDGAGDLDVGDVGDGAPTGPIRVAGAGGALRGIAEFGPYVYWVQSDMNSGIVRALKDGSGPSEFVDRTFDAFDVAVDAGYVYWSTRGNLVFRKPNGSDASDGVPLFSGPSATRYIAAGTSGRIFVTGMNTLAVGPRPDAGISDVLYPPQMGAAGIAVNGTDLFWSLDTGILRGRDDGIWPVQPVYRGMPGEVAGIATDGDDVYWIASDGAVRAISLNDPITSAPREVCRARVEMGDAAVDARADAAGSAVIADVAVDDQWVYFTEPAIPQISKCAKR
jgi:hypothetical protein